jgi:hypothetical protein
MALLVLVCSSSFVVDGGSAPPGAARQRYAGGRLLASSSSTTVAVPVDAVATSGVVSASKGGNPVVQLVDYVKDSVVRMVDGVQVSWKNYGRCNEIRAKQKKHREALRLQWEDAGVPCADINKRLKTANGGISYDEYTFLQKGKEDRGKLTQIVLMSWGAPKFLPYALMFYPQMLPSAFAPQEQSGGMESKMQKLSRERSHAVIQTLLNMENEARVVPALAKLNIFGRKAQQEAMNRMDTIGKAVADILVAPVGNSTEGGELVLDRLAPLIYSQDEPNAKSKRLVTVPKAMIKGLAQTIEGSSPLDSLVPVFITRGKLLNHLKKITESDEFLIAESVDLGTLGTQRLAEACKDRLISGLGKSNDEMREILSQWLDQTVQQPAKRVQESGNYYNGNLARAALMGYHALQGAKDSHSASYLPRSLFLGLPPAPPAKHENISEKKKSGFFR